MPDTRIALGHHCSKVLITLGAVVAGSACAWAGFDWPTEDAAGNPVLDANKKYDGEPIGRAGSCPASTLAKLKSTFALNDAQAKAKLEAIRKNVQKAIDLVKEQNADLGKCLQDMLNCERLCIDFKGNANASALPDGTTACNKDTINIGVNRVSCMEQALHHGSIYETFSSLLHEALHASPFHRQLLIDVYGSSQAAIEIHRVNAAGVSLGILGAGTTDARGNLHMFMAQPFAQGTAIQVRDLTNGISSLPNRVAVR